MEEEPDWAKRLEKALAVQAQLAADVKRLRIRSSILLGVSVVLVAAVVAIGFLGWRLYDVTHDVEDLAQHNEIANCRLRNSALASGDARWDALFDSLEGLFPESSDVIGRLREDSEAAAEPPRDCDADADIDADDFTPA